MDNTATDTPKAAQPLGLSLHDGLGPLVACPFCGKLEGYRLAEGETYRWWLVQCKACGAGVAECRSDRRTQAGAELPAAWPDAAEAWNEAGKHADELRQALQHADNIMGHEDEHTAWRERWQHLWPWGGPNVGAKAPT